MILSPISHCNLRYVIKNTNNFNHMFVILVFGLCSQFSEFTDIVIFTITVIFLMTIIIDKISNIAHP